MTCGPAATTFRIFDRHAAWEQDLRSEGAATLGEVIELAPRNPAGTDPGTLARVIPPPWIARGEPCEWFLVCPPSQLLRYGPRPAEPCAAPRLGAVPIAGPGCHLELIDPVAIAAARRRVAVLDRGRGELVIATPEGDRIVAAIPTRARGPIAFAGASILVADGEELAAYALVTLDRRALPRAPGAIARLIAVNSAVWAAVDAGGGELALYQLVGDAWRAGKPVELQQAARGSDTGIAWADTAKACLELPRRDEPPRTAWIDRCGRPAEPPPAPPPSTEQREGRVVSSRGGGASGPIDSGIPRCVWHRVRIDLELPARTGADLRLATVESPDVSPEEVAPDDWQVVDLAAVMPPGASTSDFLIEQPPGRYLFLDLRLRGDRDGDATPRIRRLRIDFPRSTSATRLPGIYREDPFAAGFLERFVALFDASIEDLDRAIDRFPALLDPEFAPPEALTWLGEFLDIVLDPAWPEPMRRALLVEAPELYRRRGTPWALSRAIELVAGIRPKILETHGTNPFARLARAGGAHGFRLGDARLFGRARARFWLGASSLGDAPLRSYGDPDRDHVAELGWRITVQVPSGTRPTADAISRMRRIIESQKPAHVVAAVRTEAELLRLGIDSSVGIDTYLGRPPPPYLGTSTRLRRTVLAYGRNRGAGIAVGTASAIGIHTVLS
ncbi:MAG TPA: phage tail protein [Kofleriaceae bacterium]|nr:phage tail protein [Kofleriaceae bacterium]